MQEKDVIVFGRTGVGKSTIANMLVTGHLSPTPVFPIGDGMQGVTGKCRRKEGRNCSVVDTVGLSEASGLHAGATEQARRYLRRARGDSEYFTHILFVVRGGRHQADDGAIWHAFLELFKGAEPAFVVCITGASNADYLEENRRSLERRYPECGGRFICVDFPPLECPALEPALAARRRRSLKHLEKRLGKIFERNGMRSFRPDLSTPSPPPVPPTPRLRQLTRTRVPDPVSTLERQPLQRRQTPRASPVSTRVSALTAKSGGVAMASSGFSVPAPLMCPCSMCESSVVSILALLLQTSLSDSESTEDD